MFKTYLTEGAKEICNLLAITALISLCSGCLDERTMFDLENFIDMAHKNTNPSVKPLPNIIEINPVVYTPSQSDPFSPSNVFGVEDIAEKPFIDPLEPDETRISEPLEAFPLDSLQLVGTMQLGLSIWGLVSSPDGQIFRVFSGSYLGQNNGKIISIDQDKGELKIQELVKGVTGRWELRLVTMSSG